jgi:predicted transcriptional regulator with HTH domain
MPRISKQKRDKVQEQILFYLYTLFPKQVFTSDIAKEIARDEEFVKSLMLDLLKTDLVVKIDKNPEGINYTRRARWRISNKAYEIYSKQQPIVVQNQLQSLSATTLEEQNSSKTE